MKRLAAGLILSLLLLLPAAAWAGASTDAALALGSFAVLNQIIGGTGIFAGLAGVAPVHYAPPPPPVYVAPPPPVYVVPRPVYVAPRPVYVAPRAVYVAPRPVVVHKHVYYSHHGHGHWKHGEHWKHYRHDD
jgi:hypothetical protein